MRDYTDITILADMSGSMANCVDDTIGGFNSFIEDQKSHGSNACVTLILFDDRYDVVYEARPINEVPLLTRQTYVPRGTTALLDAFGRTINRKVARLAALPDHERPDKVFVFCISDGHENASREFSKEKLGEMVKTQKEVYNWTFLFAGADFDAFAAGRSFGYTGQSINYSKAGSKEFFAQVSNSTKNFRLTGKLEV